MAIADRLNKLRTDIEDTYQAITEIGGTIPSNKNTNNIPEAIRSVYDNLPKVSDTGTNVSLNPTLKGRLGIVPKGNTYQESTTGKNLLDTSGLTEKTQNGVTITPVYESGLLKYININGTFDGSSNYSYKVATLNVTNGTTYYMSGVTGWNYNTLQLFANSSQAFPSGNRLQSYNGETSREALADETISIGLYVYGGQTYNNVKVYPMISTSGGDYEPYTNGASPNPDYPQEIQSATGTQKVVVSGKNLLPFTNQDYTYKNVRYYVQNGNLYLDGTSTGETYANAFKDIFSFYLEAGTYSFKQYSDNATSKYCRKYSDNTNLAVLNSNNREATFTLNERTQVYFGLYVYNQSFDNELLEIQLEKGSTATPYQPYQEPQEVDIELSSRNLFDKDSITNNYYYDASGNYVAVNETYLSDYINANANESYTLQTALASTTKRVNYFDSNKNWLSQVNTGNADFTFTTPNNTKYIRVSFNRAVNKDNIQLEQGTATSYTPYYNYTPNKIGNYEDYIGGTPDNWVLYKNIGKVVLNGSENWGAIGNDRYYITIQDKRSLTTAVACCLYSDYFNETTNAGDATNIGQFTEGYYTTGNQTVRFNYNGSNNDLAGFKTWLSTHNTEVLYVLATTQQIPITEEPLVSQLNELYYLMSYNDTTNIDVTGNLPMRITASAIKGE